MYRKNNQRVTQKIKRELSQRKRELSNLVDKSKRRWEGDMEH